MKREDFFPSKYLRAADLKGRPVVVEILEAVPETLKGIDGKQQLKTVLYFVGEKKSLPLNRTNWDAVCGLTGEEDIMNWAGHKIELFPTTVEMAGNKVEAVRIRKPSSPKKREKPAAPPRPSKPSPDETDDEIPY